MRRALLWTAIVLTAIYLDLLFIMIDTVTHGWTFLGASK